MLTNFVHDAVQRYSMSWSYRNLKTQWTALEVKLHAQSTQYCMKKHTYYYILPGYTFMASSTRYQKGWVQKQMFILTENTGNTKVCQF